MNKPNANELLGNVVSNIIYNNPSCGPSCDRQRNA